MPNTSSTSPPASHWRDALRWGFGIALVHRLFLTVWLATVWLMVGEPYGLVHALEITEARGQANLPQMQTPMERAFLGIWRRWDGTHYLNLAQNGYRLSDPGPTVFSPLAPVSIRLMDTILPGPAEIAGIIFSTLMFGLALTFMYRFIIILFDDVVLAKRALMLMALLPLSYFFNAIMSESTYLAMVIGFFMFGASRQWKRAALCAALATLARAQGIALIGVAGLMLIEQAVKTTPDWRGRVQYLFKHGWSLVLIPAAYASFMLYRSSLGLPSMTDSYYQFSYWVQVDPITGLLWNLRLILADPINSLLNVDYVALLISLVLIIILIRHKRLRRWSLIAYCAGYLAIFVTKLNYPWGTGEYVELGGTQSIGRYTLVLFPLVILLADTIWKTPKWLQISLVTLSFVGLLVFSAQFAMGGGPA
jgi:hypothetical protein